MNELHPPVIVYPYQSTLFCQGGPDCVLPTFKTSIPLPQVYHLACLLSL